MQDLVPSNGWKRGSCALPIPFLPVMVAKGRGWGGTWEQSWMTRLNYIMLMQYKLIYFKSYTILWACAHRKVCTWISCGTVYYIGTEWVNDKSFWDKIQSFILEVYKKYGITFLCWCVTNSYKDTASDLKNVLNVKLLSRKGKVCMTVNK